MNESLPAGQRHCPVCGELPERGTLLYKRSVDPAKLTGFSYASRKTPEFMCYQLVKCGKCHVVFAADPIDTQQIHQAYDESLFDSSAEAGCAADSYVQALTPHLNRLGDRRAVLEIGAGTGVFLDRIGAYGFKRLVGIEPSRSAINAATDTIRPHLRHGIFHGEDFPSQSFSLICCFMTMEHVSDPLELVRQCHRLLIPGGMLALVTHDYTALINRLLGRRSPIIDIEHLQLFHPRSVSALLSSCHFSDICIQRFVNRYRLAYWVKLLPAPSWLRASAFAFLDNAKFGDYRLSVNVGNLLTIAQKKGMVCIPSCNWEQTSSRQIDKVEGRAHHISSRQRIFTQT